MAAIDGLEATRRILRTEGVAARVLVLTTFDESGPVRAGEGSDP